MIVRDNHVRIIRTDVIAVISAPGHEEFGFFLFEPFKGIPDFEEIGAEPFTADQYVRDVLPFGIPVLRFFLSREQV